MKNQLLQHSDTDVARLETAQILSLFFIASVHVFTVIPMYQCISFNAGPIDARRINPAMIYMSCCKILQQKYHKLISSDHIVCNLGSCVTTDMDLSITVITMFVFTLV